MKLKRSLMSGALSIACLATAAAAELDTAKIDELTGLKGKFNQEEGVHKVSLPRTDVNVTVDGVRMPAFMGLTSWAAFTLQATTARW